MSREYYIQLATLCLLLMLLSHSHALFKPIDFFTIVQNTKQLELKLERAI